MVFAPPPDHIVPVPAFSRHETIPPRGHKDVHYGLSAPQGVNKITLEAKLRYRQADQE